MLQKSNILHVCCTKTWRAHLYVIRVNDILSRKIFSSSYAGGPGGSSWRVLWDGSSVSGTQGPLALKKSRLAALDPATCRGSIPRYRRTRGERGHISVSRALGRSFRKFWRALVSISLKVLDLYSVSTIDEQW